MPFLCVVYRVSCTDRALLVVLPRACRLFTIQVCAVLASESAETYDEPFVEREMLRQLHPLVLNGQWVFDEDEDSGGDKNSVAEHLRFLSQNSDPELKQPYLRMCVLPHAFSSAHTLSCCVAPHRSATD